MAQIPRRPPDPGPTRDFGRGAAAEVGNAEAEELHHDHTIISRMLMTLATWFRALFWWAA